MNKYYMIQNSRTFAFSAENPTGVRAGGSRGGDCTKLRPTVTIPAGQTVTLADAAGPGVIQHMWFTGYVGHHFIIRMYWDDQEYPSVEAPLSAFFGCAYDENYIDRDGRYPVLNSAMILVAPGRGYNSYFEMPFHKRARITMENRGDKDENLYYIIISSMLFVLSMGISSSMSKPYYNQYDYILPTLLIIMLVFYQTFIRNRDFNGYIFFERVQIFL